MNVVKNDKAKFLLCGLFFVVLAMITFRCVFGADVVFSASDVNLGGLAHRKNMGPDLFLGFFRPGPILGATNYSFSLFNLMVVLFPLHLFSDIFYGLMLLIGSASMVWFLRMWRRSWMASVFGALIAFWVNSILLAHVGHVYKIEVLVFSALSLCLIEKAVRAEALRGSVGYALLAGLSVGIMLLEQQDVALLAGLFVGPYAFFRLIQAHGKAVLRWGALLLPLAAVALLLAGNNLLKSYQDNIVNAAQVQGNGSVKWNYVTQWSAVPGEWPDLIAPGWGGWTTGDPEGPYWGKLGRSAEWETTKQGFQNFKLNSNYFGIIPFLLGGFGFWMALRNRRSEEAGVVLFWAVAGLLGLWLAFGKYSLLYKLFYQLPLVGSIRAPIKLLDNFQICLAILAAYGLDFLVQQGKGVKATKGLWITTAVFGAIMLLAGLKLLLFPASQLAEFARLGFGTHAKVLLNCMSNAWFHAALLTLLSAGLAFAAWKGTALAKWVPAVFVLLVAADSLLLTSRHFKAQDISPLKAGHPAINFFKVHQGNERAFFLDQSGIYNQWLAVDRGYHGLNLFNIWQMNRMPTEYRAFLNSVGRNKIRLWELSAVKYIAGPAAVYQQLQQNPQFQGMFEPVLNYQVPTSQGMRSDVVLEFKNAIPRFSLFYGWNSLPLDQHCNRLVSARHNPLASVLVDAAAEVALPSGSRRFQPLTARLSKNKASLEVQAEAPAIVRFSQRYQPGWRAYVDGREAELLRLDYLCMGVQVPPGRHEVEFRCPQHIGKAVFSFSVFAVSLLMAGGLLKKRPGGGGE